MKKILLKKNSGTQATVYQYEKSAIKVISDIYRSNTELDNLEFLSLFKEKGETDSIEMKEIKSVVIQLEKCEITKKNDHSLDMIRNSGEMEFEKAYSTLNC